METTSQANTTPAQLDLPEPPAITRYGMLGLSALVALSALPWMWFSIGRFGGFDWTLFGFETLTLLGAVYGTLLGLGRYRAGWAIGVTSIAGSWLVCLVFGLYVGFYRAKLQDNPDLATLAQGTLGLRAAAIALAGLLATVAVFSRNPRAWRHAILGVLWGLPILIVGGLVSFEIGPGAWLKDLYTGAGGEETGALRAVAVIFTGIVAITLVSISGHLIIRAYESGRPQDAESPA